MGNHDMILQVHKLPLNAFSSKNAIFDCPLQTQRSPKRTSSIEALFCFAVDTVRVWAVSEGGVAGSITCQVQNVELNRVSVAGCLLLLLPLLRSRLMDSSLLVVHPHTFACCGADCSTCLKRKCGRQESNMES